VVASELTNEEVNSHPKRRATEQARQQIVEWTKCIRAPPEDVEDSDRTSTVHTCMPYIGLCNYCYTIFRACHVMNSNGIMVTGPSST